MKDDQLIRIIGIVAVLAGLSVRLVTIGNGNISLFGFSMTPYSLAVLAVVVLALPETIDKLPFGPSRKT
jgi:hypothetical protein